MVKNTSKKRGRDDSTTVRESKPLIPVAEFCRLACRISKCSHKCDRTCVLCGHGRRSFSLLIGALFFTLNGVLYFKVISAIYNHTSVQQWHAQAWPVVEVLGVKVRFVFHVFVSPSGFCSPLTSRTIPVQLPKSTIFCRYEVLCFERIREFSCTGQHSFLCSSSYCKGRRFRREFNFVAFVYFKKVPNSKPNFLSWPAASRREYEIKFHANGFVRKHMKFFTYKIFFFYSVLVNNMSNYWTAVFALEKAALSLSLALP